MTFLRSLLYALWFYGSIAVIGITWLPAAAFSRRAAVAAIRLWASAQRTALLMFCGIHTEFRGLERLPKGGCIIAMKHQSTYDTIAPFLFLDDPAFILKKELLRLPLFGLYAIRARMIPIDRDGGVKTLRMMMGRAAEEAKSGRPLVIFPEGTRAEVDADTDLKSGVFAMYNQFGTPCVPVALNTGLVWKGSGFTRRPGKAVFEIQPAIEPGLPREDFMRRLYDELEPASKRLVAEGRAVQQGKPAAAPA